MKHWRECLTILKLQEMFRMFQEEFLSACSSLAPASGTQYGKQERTSYCFSRSFVEQRQSDKHVVAVSVAVFTYLCVVCVCVCGVCVHTFV